MYKSSDTTSQTLGSRIHYLDFINWQFTAGYWEHYTVGRTPRVCRRQSADLIVFERTKSATV